MLKILLAVAAAILISSCSGGSGGGGVEPGVDSSELPNQPAEDEVQVDPLQTGMLERLGATPLGDGNEAVPSDLNGVLTPTIFATETSVDLAYAQSGAALVEQLNDSFLLPVDIDVVFADCGQANAFFIPSPVVLEEDAEDSVDRIVMCHELTELFANFFSNSEQTFLATTFVLMHELGHALVEVLSLPVLGIEESYVDGIAAVLLGESGLSEGSVLAGWFFGSQPETPFFDSHRAGPQRLGDLACWGVGADQSLQNDPLISSLSEQLMEGGRNCVAEYRQQVRGLSAVLGDNIRGGLNILGDGDGDGG